MFTTSIYKQLNSRIEYTKVGKRQIRLSIYHEIDDSPSFISVKFVFFFLNFLVYLNFTLVARGWPKFILSWENAERKLMELQVMQHQDIKLRRRIKTVFFVIMFFAFSISPSLIVCCQDFSSRIFFSVEHNLGIASGLYLSKSCWNVRSAEEAFFRQSFTDFFAVFKFNIYLGVFAQVINVFWYDRGGSPSQNMSQAY